MALELRKPLCRFCVRDFSGHPTPTKGGKEYQLKACPLAETPKEDT